MPNKTILMTVTILLTCLPLWTCKKKDIDVDITSNGWKVKSIKKSGQTFSDKAKNSYFLEFTSDTTYKLTLDVNYCNGQYSIPKKGKIIFGIVGCTEICCDTDFAESIPGLIHNITDYYIKGGILTLTGDGQIKLKRL
ncbi:MAG: META domain-containing protein [Bacteroidia bacterium]|nr:META domain-containing protein [Bacteroidia bacterium]